MENTYVLVLLVAALIAIGVVFLVMRGRAKPPGAAAPPSDAARLDDKASFQATAAETLVDPIAAIPPEAVAASMPAEVAEPLATSGPPDDLTRIKGLGPKAADRLAAVGITRYDQLAALSGDDLVRVDDRMGTFRGRIVRDRWVEQAGHLAAGDTAGFEAKFGKLG